MSKERRDPPVMSALNRGHFNDAIAAPAAQFEAENPDMKARFVFSPEGKSNQSRVTKRKMEGYRPVKAEDAGIDPEFADANDEVRVGDVVMMATPRENYDRLRKANEDRAAEERSRIQPQYKAALEAVQVHGPSGSHRGRATGSVSITSEDVNIPIPEE